MRSCYILQTKVIHQVIWVNGKKIFQNNLGGPGLLGPIMTAMSRLGVDITKVDSMGCLGSMARS